MRIRLSFKSIIHNIYSFCIDNSYNIFILNVNVRKNSLFSARCTWYTSWNGRPLQPVVECFEKTLGVVLRQAAVLEFLTLTSEEDTLPVARPNPIGDIMRPVANIVDWVRNTVSTSQNLYTVKDWYSSTLHSSLFPCTKANAATDEML